MFTRWLWAIKKHIKEPLLDCPFCGRKAEAVERSGGWTVGCTFHVFTALIDEGRPIKYCWDDTRVGGIMTKMCDTEASARTLWNILVRRKLGFPNKGIPRHILYKLSQGY